MKIKMLKGIFSTLKTVKVMRQHQSFVFGKTDITQPNSKVGSVLKQKQINLRPLKIDLKSSPKEQQKTARMNIPYFQDNKLNFYKSTMVINEINSKDTKVTPVEVSYSSRKSPEQYRIRKVNVPKQGVKIQYYNPQTEFYLQRRNQIAQLNGSHKYGQKIADIVYTAEQTDLWCRVYEKLSKLHKTAMCQKYNDQMKHMEKAFGMAKRIPQLQQLSEYLTQKSGFRIKPVAGLMGQREFLNTLAFKHFCSTQYIRNPKSPDHSPQPDIIHEVIGHMAMLADPQVAAVSHKIGLLSLGASDEVITQLGTLYWFTIEFGACRQGDGLRGYGAGIASSVGQIENMLSGKARFQKLNTAKDCRQKFNDQTVQPVYKVTEDFQECIRDLEAFGEQISQPHKAFDNEASKQLYSDKRIINLMDN